MFELQELKHYPFPQLHNKLLSIIINQLTYNFYYFIGMRATEYLLLHQGYEFLLHGAHILITLLF